MAGRREEFPRPSSKTPMARISARNRKTSASIGEAARSRVTAIVSEFPTYDERLVRTSMFVERIRPVSQVDWLESDAPELLDGLSPEDGDDLMQNYPSAQYFSYDGRPIFDCDHFRQSLVIADPIPGDSMIYVLNPLVVAPDGEWEAWRFANWIPGAERFPSFELLMRAEHALFLNNQPRPEAVVLARFTYGLLARIIL